MKTLIITEVQPSAAPQNYKAVTEPQNNEEQESAQLVIETPSSGEQVNLSQQETRIRLQRDEIQKRLDSGEEVQLTDFRAAGFKFADMDDTLQRKETIKDVRDLMESLMLVKCFYRPIEILPVRALLECNMKAFRVDGTEINLSDSDVDLHFVRPDGKQRSIAYAKLFSNKEYVGKESEYDVRVSMCRTPVKELQTYVREIQTAASWDEKTKRQTVVAAFGSQESGLTLIDLFTKESKMSARGAFKLIYRKEGYKKSLYERSMKVQELVPELKASPELIKRAKHDYKCLRIAFRDHPEYMKNSMAVNLLIDVYASATDNQNEEVKQYLTFLMSLCEEDFSALKAQSGQEERTVCFKRMWEFFKSEYDKNQQYAEAMNGRVSKATAEFYEKIKSEQQSQQCEPVKVSAEQKYFGN